MGKHFGTSLKIKISMQENVFVSLQEKNQTHDFFLKQKTHKA